MTKTIDLAQQPTLAELLALTAEGNAVVLKAAGAPVATLTPARTPASSGVALRTPGLQPEAFIYVADDWDAPLPDEFWDSADR